METHFDINTAIKALKTALGSMPKKSGVYKMLNKDKKILYIGKAKNLPNRVKSYLNYDALPYRLKRMVAQITEVEYIITGSEAEALLLEANLIKQNKPVYNISLRDDKSFPYILFEEKHDFPRIIKYRGTKNIKGSYFGPFASALSVKIAIQEIQKAFRIRSCSDSYFANRTRPCIKGQIKQCSAPCVGRISKEAYKVDLKMAKDFLLGRAASVQRKLAALMEEYSKNLEYEKAAIIRDKIKTLNMMQAKNTFANFAISDADLIILYRKYNRVCIQLYIIRGGKNYGNREYFYNSEAEDTELLETFIGLFYQRFAPPKYIILSHELPSKLVIEKALQENYKVKVALTNDVKFKNLINFGLINAQEALENKIRQQSKAENSINNIANLFDISTPIKRIEIYDNSHISGTNAVGCMVVYTPDGFDKSQYKKFNIKTTSEADDYAMLKEMLTRRFKKPSELPDLILIDGGKSHLSVAIEALKMQKNIKIVCISKGVDRNAGREFFHMEGKISFQLPINDSSLHFLQMLRDEAHRYAITSHRNKRIIELKKSQLDLIPGIGRKRKLALLQYFGSYDAVLTASVEELTKVNGISKAVAQKICQCL